MAAGLEPRALSGARPLTRRDPRAVACVRAARPQRPPYRLLPGRPYRHDRTPKGDVDDRDRCGRAFRPLVLAAVPGTKRLMSGYQHNAAPAANPWGEEVPMRKRNDDRKVARARFGRSGARLLAFAERSLEAVDGVDDKVRRWLFPVTYGRATSSSRDGVRLSRAALPRDVQDAIGRQLRAEYPVEQSLPATLANLLRQFEARGNAAPMRGSAA
jgi:hypothetical protein